jgi:SAM-dependent methyltransferase
MSPGDRTQTHWDQVWSTRDPKEVSWFQAEAAMSLELIASVVAPTASVVDVGGGASTLVDGLLARGHDDLAVLDVSAAALAQARLRLGDRADAVDWVVADVTAWTPARRYDLWHDRAVLHFLVEPGDQAAYAAVVGAAVAPGGHVVIGTFAPDGPEQCSGLDVCRHDAASVMALLPDRFRLIDERRETHLTPAGGEQRFSWVVAQG